MAQTLDNMPNPSTTNTRIGLMTRAQVKDMQDKVNLLLISCEFNISMNGLLPDVDTLYILEWEPERGVEKKKLNKLITDSPRS